MDRAMDETKSLSETQGSQPIGEGSTGSSDETRGLSDTNDFHPHVESSDVSSPGDPTKIGRYQIIRRLGQGGFGRVYLAHDDDLDRPVAIKVPNPDRISHPEDVEAYLNEARILARLDHPDIVKVFDVGRDGGWPLFRGLQAGGGHRPGGQDRSRSSVLPGCGGTGRHDCRRIALRPYPGAGAPGHQACQHPHRCLG